MMRQRLQLALLTLAMLVCGSLTAQTNEEYVVESGGFRTTYLLNQYDYWGWNVATVKKVEIIEGQTPLYYMMPENGSVYYGNTYYRILYIGDQAFKNLSSLQTVVLGNGIRSIGSQAFAYCSNLKSINMPTYLNYMGTEAFLGCRRLERVDLSGTDLTTIPEKAFKDCKGITELTFPSALGSIKSQAFYGCYGLDSLTLPAKLYEIGDSAFEHCYWLSTLNAKMMDPPYIVSNQFPSSGLCQLTVPQGTRDAYDSKGWMKVFPEVNESSTITKDIDGYRLTFQLHKSGYNEVKLTAVEALTSPGTTLTVPEELTSGTKTFTVTGIAAGACQGIGQLQAIVLPPTLKKGIGSKAFANNPNLSSVTVEGILIPTTSSDAFTGCAATCQAHIPYCTAATHEAQGWTTALFPGGIHPETVFTAETEEGISMTYKVTGLDPNTVQVGTGDAPAIDVATAGALTLPQTVSYKAGDQSMTYTVTTIADGAFEGCTGLTVATLPASLTAIGNRAFGGCSALAEVYSQIQKPWQINDQVFTGLPEGAKLYVPQGTDQLYNTAGWYFYFGGGIVNGEVFVENGMTFLKTGPSTVAVGDGNDPAVDVSTAGALEIPTTVEHNGTTYTVTALSWGAFYGCAALTSVTIPEGITDILPSTFAYCTALETVALPSTLLTIQNYAFNGCSALTTINLPEGLVSIGNFSFQRCTSLTTLTLPSTLTSMERSFEECTGLTHVYSNIMTPFGIGAFLYINSDCVLTVPLGMRDAYINCSGWGDGTGEASKTFASVVEDDQAVVKTIEGVPVRYYLTARLNIACIGHPNNPRLCIPEATVGSVTIPETIEYLGTTYKVTRLGLRAFDNATGITSVTIPSTVTSVNDYVFRGCSALQCAVVPKTSAGMFSGCSALQDVTITDENSNIAAQAFAGCTSLQHITLPSNMKTIGSNAFNNNPALEEIEIPATVTTIGKAAFAACTSLKSVILPASLSSLSDQVFYWSRNIESIVAKSPTPVDITSLPDFVGGLSSKCVLTVPVGTRDAYIAAGWTEKSADNINGRFYKVVEETVEDNHTFLLAGEGARVWVEWTQNGVHQERTLMNGIIETGYLNDVGIADAYLYYIADDGCEVRILKNGEDMIEGFAYDNGEEMGLPCKNYMILNEPGTVDPKTTWVVTVNRRPSEAGSTTNVGDVNGDGAITMADVTFLVDVILGKAVMPGPISNVTLDYDVVLKPDGNYTTLSIPVSDRLVSAFTLAPAQIASKLLTQPAEPQNGEVELVAYNADGTANTSYTTNNSSGELGYWFSADGYPGSWDATASKAAVWFDKNAAQFVVSCHPQAASGDALTAKLVLIYKNNTGQTATATVNFHITYDAEATNAATLR